VENTEKKQPVPYVPPSQLSVEDLSKALAEDGVIEAPPEPAKPAPPVAEKPAEPAKPSDDLPALVKIAKEREAFRKEVDAAKPYLDTLKNFTPQEAQRLAQARAAGNPVAALAALGFTHAQYTNALLGEKETPSEAPAEKPSSDIDTLRQEIAALKAERENERIAAGRKEGLAKMREILKGSKFEMVNKLEAVESVEGVIMDYIRQYGKPPGDTFEESVMLAAEVADQRLRQEAEKWSKVLTPAANPAPTAPAKAPESQPSSGTVVTRTLTNSNTSAPAAVKSVPKTREEVIQALIEGREAELE